MTVNYTSLLSLGQPVTGTESGTWGDDVNNAVTSYLDIAIAGTLTLTGDGAVTLANTQGTNTATNIGSTTAQYAILKIVGPLTATKVITAPTASKTYLVINTDSTYGVTVKASGQSGVTVAAGTRALVVFNGTDYVSAAASSVSVSNIGGLGTGVATALAVNTGTAGSFVVNGGALGTPSSGTVTNLTGTASININGTVGATTPTTGAFTTLSVNGDITISGTARRVIGSYDATSTSADRTLFQASTTNAGTSVGAIPNGTSTTASFAVFNNSALGNCSRGSFQIDNDTVNIVAGIEGTGTYLPITFITSGNERARINTNGEIFIAGTTDRGAYNLQCNGTGVWGQGAYVNGSDARMKEDVSPITSGLDVVAKLNPVQFRYKKEVSRDTNLQPGFIAQELKVALEDKAYVNGVVQKGSEFYSVAYQTLIPILVKAIQELKAEVDALKGK